MLKIRSSQVGKIMPGVRKDWLKGTEDYLFELWVYEKYGRTKDIKSKYMQKGTKQELEAITLLNDVTGELYFKNEVHLENDWQTGTPDIWKKRDGYIRDVKCSWDVFTFEKSKKEDLNSDYYWQLQSYMDLTETDKAYLDYCLVDTPENLIEREQYYLEKDEEFSNLDDLVTARKELRQSLMFGDIPDKDRIYTVEIERNDEDINLIHERVEMCREWMDKNLNH